MALTPLLTRPSRLLRSVRPVVAGCVAPRPAWTRLLPAPTPSISMAASEIITSF